MPNLFSSKDKTLWGAIFNNKFTSISTIVWYLLYRRENTPSWVLDLLADYIMLDDRMDIGQFNRLHHWQTAYIMKILNKSKKAPKHRRREIIIEGLSTMFDEKRRKKFLRGK